MIEGFELLNVHALDSERILESDVPEEVLLAILGKYPIMTAASMIKRVIDRLKELCGEEARFNKYLKQLIILRRLRKLELETKRTIEEMPITYDITKDGLYLEGKKDGIQQERKKRNLEIAETLLKRGMSAVEVSEISTLSVEEVYKIQKRLGSDNM